MKTQEVIKAAKKIAINKEHPLYKRIISAISLTHIYENGEDPNDVFSEVGILPIIDLLSRGMESGNKELAGKCARASINFPIYAIFGIVKKNAPKETEVLKTLKDRISLKKPDWVNKLGGNINIGIFSAYANIAALNMGLRQIEDRILSIRRESNWLSTDMNSVNVLRLALKETNSPTVARKVLYTLSHMPSSLSQFSLPEVINIFENTADEECYKISKTFIDEIKEKDTDWCCHFRIKNGICSQCGLNDPYIMEAPGFDSQQCKGIFKPVIWRAT